MSIRILRSLLVTAVFAVLSLAAAPARAQVADQLTFRTGFPFVVGSRVMPAGRYEISRVSEDQFLFEVSGPRTALLEVHYAGQPPASGASHDEILFRRFRNELVMSEIWDADSSSGVVAAAHYRGEHEARNQTPLPPVSVIANPFQAD